MNPTKNLIEPKLLVGFIKSLGSIRFLVEFIKSLGSIIVFDRDDTHTSYQAGSKLQQTKRLSNITT